MNQNLQCTQDAPLQDLTLLLADDELRLRQIVVLMAEELGANVIAVDNCEDAVSIYQQHGLKIDVIMLDLCMEVMGGEAAFKLIRDIDPTAKIVLSSGIRPSNDLIRQLHESGGDFMEKPFDINQLGRVLCAVARGSK